MDGSLRNETRTAVLAEESSCNCYSQLRGTWTWENPGNTPKTFRLYHRKHFPEHLQPLVAEPSSCGAPRPLHGLLWTAPATPRVGIFLNPQFQLFIFPFAALRSSLLTEIFLPWEHPKIISSALLKPKTKLVVLLSKADCGLKCWC